MCYKHRSAVIVSKREYIRHVKEVEQSTIMINGLESGRLVKQEQTNKCLLCLKSPNEKFEVPNFQISYGRRSLDLV